MQPILAYNIAILAGDRGGRRVVALRGTNGDITTGGLSADEWDYAEAHVEGFTEMLAALGITREDEGVAK